MPDNIENTENQAPARYQGRIHFIGRRQLKPKVRVNGRLFERRSLLRGTVLTDANGVEVFRTRRRFVIDGVWIHA